MGVIYYIFYSVFTFNRKRLLKARSRSLVINLNRFGYWLFIGPQTIDSKTKKQSLQKRQEEDDGVDVDPVITVSNIEVFDVTTAGPPAVVSSSEENNSVAENVSASEELETDAPVNVDDAPPLNRYCKCTSYECKCCRDFSLPIVPINGPGCASIRYLEGDKMTIGIKFGNRVLATRTISGMKE